MTSQEVLQVAGEPSKKRDIALANLWIYEKSDRTVIFRKDTVFDIITSANARVDTIERSLDKIGDKIKTQAKKAGKKIDSLSRILKIGSPKDSVKK
jgi:hypothetical protein